MQIKRTIMKFLSLEEQCILNNLFAYRTVKKWKNKFDRFVQKSKKCIVPIGVHELKLHNIEWIITKKTKEPMLHIQISKPPEFDGVSNTGKTEHNVSFEYISCYHLISNKAIFKLNERWFYPVGRFYTEQQLNLLMSKKGAKFKALVRHSEQTYNNNLFFKAEIEKVYTPGEIIDYDNIDYFKLYKKLKS